METSPFFSSKPFFIRFLYLLLIWLGAFFVFAALAQLISETFFRQGDSTTLQAEINLMRIIQSITSIGVWFIPALIFSFLSTESLWKYSEITNSPKCQQILIVFLLAFFILPLVLCLAAWNESLTFPASWRGIENWFRSYYEESERILNLLIDNPKISVLLFNVLLLGVLPAVCEEFFFRGTILPFLTQWTKNKHISIIITAFIFSAVHLDIYGFLPRFLLGIYLGYLFFWGKSLWLPIVAHFSHNTISVVLQYLVLRNGIDVETAIFQNQQLFIPILILSLIITMTGIIWLKKGKILSK